MTISACPNCGKQTLQVMATLMTCTACGVEFGRVNEQWVEVPQCKCCHKGVPCQCCPLHAAEAVTADELAQLRRFYEQSMQEAAYLESAD